MRWGVGTVQSGKPLIDLSDNIPNPFSMNTEISTRRIALFVRSRQLRSCTYNHLLQYTRVGTLIVATIYLQLIQNRYMFRSFTVLQCSHQHCVQSVASDVEVVGYL